MSSILRTGIRKLLKMREKLSELVIFSLPAGIYGARIMFMNDVMGVARFVKE